MLPIPDLVTLPAVKAWLGTEKSQTADTQLQRLITSASGFVLGFCQREQGFDWQQVNEFYDGNGNNFMLLRQWPVTDIVSVGFEDGTVINTPNVFGTFNAGYILEPAGSTQQRLTLIGWRFPRGRSNVQVSYHAGYLVSGEAATIPAAPNTTSGTYLVDTMRPWLADQGVVYASSGDPLTAVTSAPTAGQYMVDSQGNYIFAAADAGTAVKITYSYCPEDVQQAVIELVGERYKAATRIGETSHVMNASGAMMTTGFSQKDMNDFIKSLLQPYRKVTSS